MLGLFRGASKQFSAFFCPFPQGSLDREPEPRLRRWSHPLNGPTALSSITILSFKSTQHIAITLAHPRMEQPAAAAAAEEQVRVSGQRRSLPPAVVQLQHA
jgi:hypothetical protein